MNSSETTVEEAAKQAAEGLRSSMETGAQTLKTNFDKALGNYDRIVDFGKETSSAFGKAASAARKGAESLHDEFYAYSRRSIENTLAATGALVRSKNLNEALQVQAGFAKSAYEAYTDEVTKLSEMALALTREALEPLNGRAQAWLDVVQGIKQA
jgi:phasin family protein